jgi:putative transposase
MPREDVQEDALHTRFVVARAFATGRLHDFDRARACDELGISLRTLRRDIARAKNCLTIDEWRPKKRGPPKGQRRVKHEVLREVESVVYSAADQKLNVRKLGRDLERLLAGRGIAAIDVPSQSTLERLVHDIEDADPAFFAERRHGRIGRAAHTLQRGSLETSRPLEIVCIDHTVLNARTFLIEGEEIIVRPTFTAVIDLFTSCCLAAFISAFPPSRITVSLAMALMVTPKTDLLRAYGIPGEWEARGLPEVLYVDGAAELKSDAVKRGCKLTGIELRVGWPGRPERRGRMERFWKTTESEIHSWPGTTLGNPQELRAHGGGKATSLELRSHSTTGLGDDLLAQQRDLRRRRDSADNALARAGWNRAHDADDPA